MNELPGRSHIDPIPTDVDWPRLVAIAERRGIPVLRVDREGETHIIRTTKELAEDWE